MIPRPAYLAFDLGASSSRAILGILEEGRMSMSTLHRFVTPLVTRQGNLCWDVHALWRELLVGLEKARAVAPGLKSLSVDSWGVDYVRFDANGAMMGLPYCYRDRRTEGVMERAFETVSASDVYRITGIQFLPFNTLYQAMADKEMHPHDDTALHLSLADYFNYRFSGTAVWEASMASTTQLKDISSNSWAIPLFDRFGLDHDAWPSIVPSGTVLGAYEDGPEIEVVATCSHDTGCAVAAAPVGKNGERWAYISCGTWSLLGTERVSPILTEGARLAGFTHEVGIDDTYRFLKNIVGLWVVQECVREWGVEVDWAQLTASASRVPSLGFTIDLTDKQFISRGNMPQRIAAYCEAKGYTVPEDRAAVVRLVLESLAQCYAENLARLEEVTNEDVQVIHLFGGGAQNEVLCQLTANAAKRNVVAGPVEATALGNLLIQARALGDVPAGETIRSIARRSSNLVAYQPV